MWHLLYFEDARNAWLVDRGLSLPDLIAGGHDLQVVHVDVSWRRPVRWLDAVVVRVRPVRIGRSSFTLGYAIVVDGEDCVTGETTYVVISTNHVKGPMPERLRQLLGLEMSQS